MSDLNLSRVLGSAVVGLGVGEQHARALGALAGTRLRYLYDIDTERAQRLARELDTLSSRTYEEILTANDVDLVVIASYDDAHFGQIVGALQHRKHVFSEKPLCQSIKELAAIKGVWRASAGRLQLRSNLILRTAPMYQWLRTYIQDGGLGELYAFDGDYLYGRLEKIVNGWRGRSPGYSGLKGGGIHLIDLMLWLTGQKPRLASAFGNGISTRGRALESADYVAATYAFPSGLIGRITVNLGSVHPHHHVVRIFGTLGTFIYDDAGPRLHRHRDPARASERLDLSPLPSSKANLLTEFVDCLQNGSGTALGETQNDFDAMSVCLAAEQALVANAPVAVNYA